MAGTEQNFEKTKKIGHIYNPHLQEAHSSVGYLWAYFVGFRQMIFVFLKVKNITNNKNTNYGDWN